MPIGRHACTTSDWQARLLVRTPVTCLNRAMPDFAEIVGRYHDQLRNQVERTLRGQEGVDDVLQEVYIKAFKALPSFRGDASLRTWLYRIAHNACLDELRRRRRHPSARLTVTEAEQASTAPEPAEVVLQHDQLQRALAGLPDEQRRVVLLVDGYGLDYAEAAAALGVKRGTVASRLNRARTRLVRTLEPAA